MKITQQNKHEYEDSGGSNCCGKEYSQITQKILLEECIDLNNEMLILNIELTQFRI